jgi:DNA-binding MarR family transcriptional regulator
MGKKLECQGGIIVTNNINDNYDSIDNNDKVELVNEVKMLFNKILIKHESEIDDEKRWILLNCNDPILLKKLDDMTIIMLHVLDAIGRLEHVNSITISKDTGIPKGTVSKIIPKLISKEFIIKEAIPNNKKESLFKITPLGKEVFYLHQAMHKKIETGANDFLKNYDIKDLQFIIRFLTDLNDLALLYKEPE